MNFQLRMMEQMIQQYYGTILRDFPPNSLTPFLLDVEGKIEFIFIGNCDSSYYQPLLGADIINGKKNMSLTMYTERNDRTRKENLIIRFELDYFYLESEIIEHQAKAFLTTLYHQSFITFCIVDHVTSKLIWMTNTIAFGQIRDRYQKIFKKYGVSV